jgi:hypothetical protein
MTFGTEGKSMKTAYFVALAACFSVTGCASITRGTSEDVTVNALPADSEITTSTGVTCAQSPCIVHVDRKTAFTAYAKHQGYEPGTLAIQTHVSGGGAAGLAGNILVGGIIGVGVDAATGATLDHYPNPATIVLRPVDPTNPKTPIYKIPPPPKPEQSPGVHQVLESGRIS